jgi:hypothetical protein
MIAAAMRRIGLMPKNPRPLDFADLSRDTKYRERHSAKPNLSGVIPAEGCIVGHEIP